MIIIIIDCNNNAISNLFPNLKIKLFVIMIKNQKHILNIFEKSIIAHTIILKFPISLLESINLYWE